MKNLVAPSILSADFSHLENDINKLKYSGADILHIDVMDGHFVPNITIGPVVVKDIRKVTDLPIDCHLMISNPEMYFEDFLEIGIQYISMHIELNRSVKKCYEIVKRYKAKFGIAINPETETDKLKGIIDIADYILIMTVHPGFGGQAFIKEASLKIPVIRNMGYNGLIEVDGGINAEIAKELRKLGADIIVSGSYIFRNNIKEAIKMLR
ncbi:ribulose-phosphate 3-epimerase [candidate division TA06 bacterium]|uniref:Ribulose-phosphate 3-epimerase n=1 Tax=candidate division TA06 bacterium TaxID=2250710 RepID=A0A660SNZ7_UNCT6|nr:MAG: ribulose-phosphate 3-epimerase [candidate division TA06 bacterium]